MTDTRCKNRVLQVSIEPSNELPPPPPSPLFSLPSSGRKDDGIRQRRISRSLSFPRLHGDERGAMDDDQMHGVSFLALEATGVSFLRLFVCCWFLVGTGIGG